MKKVCGYGFVLRQLTEMMTCSPVDRQRQTGISNDNHKIRRKLIHCDME